MLVFSFVYLFVLQGVTDAGRSSTWDYCDCTWVSWEAWSSCTETCGGGLHKRSRKVKYTSHKGCDEADDCFTDWKAYWQVRACNTQCFNGGTYVGDTIIIPGGVNTFSGDRYCRCPTGKKGDCCEQDVHCGRPSSISHGSFSGSRYTYGGQVNYRCDNNYKMGYSDNPRRTCSSSGYWTGSSPTCYYFASCTSYPCKNGATCTNILNGYLCSCSQGWTGKNCEVDIQPPIFDQCPSDISIQTSNLTITQIWEEPKFSDPLGNTVHVTKNYDSPSYTFPWGEYIVQYDAVKQNNGLRSECKFHISIKPYPCPDINAPINGIVICNEWQTDYARACKLLCKEGFTYPPGFSADDWFNCGASGHWLPSVFLTECVPDDLMLVQSRKTSDIRISNCNDAVQQTDIFNYYIKQLKSSALNILCENHLNECQSTNVFVGCA